LKIYNLVFGLNLNATKYRVGQKNCTANFVRTDLNKNVGQKPSSLILR